MTLPFSRRSRERRAALDGDFPETGESITEILERVQPGSYDDTRPFAGASAGTMPPAEAHREAGLRQAVEMTTPPHPAPVPPPDTLPLGKLRAQPHSAGPEPKPAPHDTGPMPKLSKYAARPRPQRPADAAIFTWSKLLQQHIMMCGVCLRSRYADPTTATMPFTFEALRVSAYVSGWRLDAFARWACPACQRTPAYRTPYPVICYDAQAAAAASPHDEYWHRAAAEHDLIRDVAAKANHGPLRVGAR